MAPPSSPSSEEPHPMLKETLFNGKLQYVRSYLANLHDEALDRTGDGAIAVQHAISDAIDRIDSAIHAAPAPRS